MSSLCPPPPPLPPPAAASPLRWCSVLVPRSLQELRPACLQSSKVEVLQEKSRSLVRTTSIMVWRVRVRVSRCRCFLSCSEVTASSALLWLKISALMWNLWSPTLSLSFFIVCCLSLKHGSSAVLRSVNVSEQDWRQCIVPRVWPRACLPLLGALLHTG